MSTGGVLQGPRSLIRRNDMSRFAATAVILAAAVMNILAFYLYGKDKRLSKRRRARRIPERTLLGVSIFGGGVGAFFGMRIFRHKTKHLSFRIIVPLTAIAWGFVLLFSVYVLLRPGKPAQPEVPAGYEAGEREESFESFESKAGMESSRNDGSDEAEPAGSQAEPAESEAESGPEPLSYDPDILANPAGTVIPEEALDMENVPSYFRIDEIHEGDEVFERINGKSYRANDDIALAELRYLKMLHYNYDGEVQVGEMIVNRAIAADVIDIFYNLFLNRYEIYSMYLVDEFWTGDGVETDDASIEADNTSCFNYRRATDAENLSRHAFGMAIDLNPYENPFIYVHPDGSFSCDHEGSYAYIENRSSEVPHVITHEDLAYQLFAAHGFAWGGDWSSPIDYQHFVK